MKLSPKPLLAGVLLRASFVRKYPYPSRGLSRGGRLKAAQARPALLLQGGSKEGEEGEGLRKERRSVTILAADELAVKYIGYRAQSPQVREAEWSRRQMARAAMRPFQRGSLSRRQVARWPRLITRRLCLRVVSPRVTRGRGGGARPAAVSAPRTRTRRQSTPGAPQDAGHTVNHTSISIVSSFGRAFHFLRICRAAGARRLIHSG